MCPDRVAVLPLGQIHFPPWMAVRFDSMKTMMPMPATFSGAAFFPVGPHRPETAILWVFSPFWALGTWRNPGPGQKTRKQNFPVLGALLGGGGGGGVTTLSEMVFRNFFGYDFFSRPDPHQPEIAI